MVEALCIIYSIDYKTECDSDDNPTHVYREKVVKVHGIVTNDWLQKNKTKLHAFRMKTKARVMVVPVDTFIETGSELS